MAGVVNVSEVASGIGLEISPLLPRYHWKVGEVPDTKTVSVAVPPLLTGSEAGWIRKTGGMITLTVAEFESAEPAALLALAQKLVVDANAGVVNVAEVASITGLEMSPLFPIYH